VCSRPAAGPINSAEPRLDIHMDIFERALELELARLDFCQDRV